MRFPVPPGVSQLTAFGPDGLTDPAAGTDCGEACLTSAVLALRGWNWAPGCVRQAMGKPLYDGRSTATQLAGAIRGIRIDSRVNWETPIGRRIYSGRLRAHGAYSVQLTDMGPDRGLHWVLVYSRQGDVVHYMNPATGGHERISLGDLESRGKSIVLDITLYPWDGLG